MYEIQRAVSINKVLLKHSHAYSFPSVYVCFHGTVTELRSGPVDCTALKALNIYYLSLSRWSEPTPVLDRQVPPVDCESQEQGQCWLSHVWPALALGPHTDYQGYLLSREPSTLCGTGDWSLGRIRNSPKPCSGSGIQTTKQSLSLLHLTDTLTMVLLNLNCPRTPTPLPRSLWHQKLQNSTPRVYDSLGLGWGPFICISSKLPREADVHLWATLWVALP